MCFGCGGHRQHEGREERGRLIGRRRPPCCTDLGFLAIYLMVICAMIIVSVLSYGEGNIYRILNPVDCVNGFTCGSAATLGYTAETGISPSLIKTLPYLFFHSPGKPLFSKSMCVPSCTSQSIIYYSNFSQPENAYYCGYKGQVEVANIQAILSGSSEDARRFRRQAVDSNIDLRLAQNLFNNPEDPLCAIIPVPTTVPLLDRCVLPNVVNWLRFDALASHTINHLAEEQNETVITIAYLNDKRIRTTFIQVAHDLYYYWSDVLRSYLVALFLASIFLVIIHFGPTAVFYVTVVFFIVGGSVLGAALWRLYVFYYQTFQQKRSDQAGWLTNPAVRRTAPPGLVMLDSQLANQTSYLVLAIISSCVFLILLPALFCMLRRMRISTKLFVEISKLLDKRASLFFAPFVTCTAVTAVATYFYMTLAFTLTSDRIVQSNHNSTETLSKECLTPTPAPLQYCWVLLLLGAIWSAELLITMQRVVVGRAICEYFFLRSKLRAPYHVLNALALIFKHHFGSLALAALLVPIFRVPRMMFGFMRKRFYEAAVAGRGGKQAQVSTVAGGRPTPQGEHQSGAALSCAEVICAPCLGCHHGLLRFMDTPMLVFLAMRSYDMLKAARDSYFLLERNALRVSALGSAARFTLFIAKITIPFVVTGAITMYHQFTRDLSLTFYMPNIIFIWVLTYYVADCFFSFYEATVDALLCCVCEDLEVNDGTLAHEYLMTVSLMDIIRNSSNQLNKLSKYSRTEYAASVIINHNLRRSMKYKKDKHLLATARM